MHSNRPLTSLPSFIIRFFRYSKLAADDEYTLFAVTIFKRVKDEFTQKAREERLDDKIINIFYTSSLSHSYLNVYYHILPRYTVREFVYNREAIEEQERALQDLEKSERELWVCKNVLNSF